ncbi:dephospho-CoA kinase [Neocallimastix lanati (nom. inval.)]|jgi:phosphopantetheine adenylyltransferase/dephospho-CoA kinase|uniref:Dephospho-CoA kinase n=1 Tax=Neocallimastix californiae TaxID=1754190 RepID=A0A1Y2AD42_9FUNG|nr:dephospho-CoA kinase [Neocallimastix sp. JGI-2020a]ORY20441.1 dephospho-CoA kinase [Neocallimastix californiae]|eukprot:ORY20441.1 dephospho-CoA kinase [Neocallimastix californiae]
MFVIGLTGGICSGKSTVAKLLHERLGVKCIDADRKAHEAYKQGTPTYDKLIKVFGIDIINPETKEIERNALGKLVFTSAKKRVELNNIVWPATKEIVRKEIENSKNNVMIILEAALLIEAGWDDLCDEIWTTETNDDLAIMRLMKRNRLTKEEALRRMNSQLSNKERNKHAKVIIRNDSNDIDALWYQIQKSLVHSQKKSALL